MASILVPFDGSSASEHALGVACHSAGDGGDEVHAVYVVHVPSQLPIGADVPAERDHAAQVLERARGIADCYGCCLTAQVVTARQAGPAIVAAAQDCDCIMIGRPARPRLYERLRLLQLDHTLRYVIAHAPCRVLVSYAPPVHEDAGTRPFRLTHVTNRGSAAHGARRALRLRGRVIR